MSRREEPARTDDIFLPEEIQLRSVCAVCGVLCALRSLLPRAPLVERHWRLRTLLQLAFEAAPTHCCLEVKERGINVP
jgi:hypothetical protein